MAKVPGTPLDRRPAGTSPPATRAFVHLTRLSIKRTSARSIRVGGRASSATARRVSFTLRTRKGRLVARTTARLRAGRFVVRMQPRRGAKAGRYRLGVRYAGDARVAPISLARTLKLT
jgi:hypothetical protein